MSNYVGNQKRKEGKYMLSEAKSFLVFNRKLLMHFIYIFISEHLLEIHVYIKVKDLKVENAWDVEHVQKTKVTIV